MADLVPFLLSASAFFAVFLCFILFRVEEFRLSAGEAIAAVVTQLRHAQEEIVGRIEGLEAAVAAGGPVEDLSGPLAELKAIAQSLDDVVPDVVVPVEPEAPAEEPVEPPAEPVG